MLRRLTPRRGFTLLEVLLSLAIAALLFGALYVAVDTQLRHMQAGRDVIEHSTLARSLITRMAGDLAPNLAPPLPTGTAADTGTGDQAAPPTGTATTDTSTPATSTATGAVSVNLGVQGDATSLTVSISQLPSELYDATANQESPPTVCDQRIFKYWIAANGGLARREFTSVTSEEALGEGVEASDENDYVIAPEVQEMALEYFDGTGWLTSWSGTDPGSDGVTPQGPPQLIAVTLTIATPSKQDANVTVTKKYRHVIAVPTANGTAQTTDATTTTTSNGQVP